MAAHPYSGEDKAWAQVEREKRIDRMVRRVMVGAWTVALVLVLGFVALTGIQVADLLRGGLPWSVIVGAAFPMMIVLGMLSVLVATLATIAVFLRLRTASLTEIQQRLATLEEILLSRDEGTRG